MCHNFRAWHQKFSQSAIDGAVPTDASYLERNIRTSYAICTEQLYVRGVIRTEEGSSARPGSLVGESRDTEEGSTVEGTHRKQAVILVHRSFCTLYTEDSLSGYQYHLAASRITELLLFSFQAITCLLEYIEKLCAFL